MGDVVLIKGEEKSKGKWNTEIVEELFKGKDDAIRGVKLQFSIFIHSSFTAIWKNQQVNTSRCKRIQTMKNSSSYC